jgi:hypothetical protein
MSNQIMEEKLKHSPTLNTVVMVEDVIRNAKNSVITVPEIKRALPRQVNHLVLKTILEYLEASGKIVVTMKGITWVHSTNIDLKRAVARGLEL